VASASVDLRRARQFLKASVRRRLIPTNPFADVPCGPQANESRTVYVSAEDIERVIAVCADNDWRLTFAMPRYAGMRFPSEFRELKWSDVDWENSRFIVYEPKVEHHPGRGHRTVPISAELRPHLERAYAEREEGAVYVLPRVRVISNLGTHAKRLVKQGWHRVVAEALRKHAGQLLRRPRAARHPLEGDQRLDRRHRPAAEQALPRRAGGGLGGRDWRRRKSGTTSGTISSRQRFTKPGKKRWTCRKP
jgi:integrase